MSENQKKLEIEKDYPWRSSLTKVARCGMCNQLNQYKCALGHEVIYPTINGEHDCKDYHYKPDEIMMPPEGSMICFTFTETGMEELRPECESCAHLFKGRCTGRKWFPIRLKNNKCEFWRDKTLICKHAIPMLQYGDHNRNNFCTLPPEQRDLEKKENKSWKCMCPWAHEKYAESMSCYEPIGGDNYDNSD